MKKYIFLIALFLLVSKASLFAQSTVTVFSENGERFWVILDGLKMNKDPQTNVYIDNLIHDKYKIRIIFEDQNLPPLDDNIYTKTFVEGYEAGSAITDESQGPSDAKYVIKKKKENYVLRTMSKQPAKKAVTTTTNNNQNQVSGYTDAPSTTTTQVKTKTVTNINQVPDNQNGLNMNISINAGADQGNMNVKLNANDMNMNTNIQGNTNTTYSQTVTTTTKTTTTGNGLPYDNQQSQVTNNNQGCMVPMSSGDFSTAKASINKQSFADTKMKVAKQITEANCLSVAQVKEIMGLFSFEDNKLEYAKFAYPYTVDKKKYYMINDAFSFSGSVDELNSFLESVGK